MSKITRRSSKNYNTKSRKSNNGSNPGYPHKVKVKNNVNTFLSPAPQVKSDFKLFPVAVIGASAGGIEAFGSLIKTLPSNTGMAFVFILHLSPNFKSNLPDILARQTKMPVKPIVHNEPPEPNTVYAIEPNTYLTIENGKFCINKRFKNNKSFMPIDIFMESLADDNNYYAIGILLSGTDSDGVLGLEHIKTKGGITFAQDPLTAKFADIPNNAIKAGVVDYVLTAENIGKELIRVGNNLDASFKKIGIDYEILPGISDEVNKIYQLLKYNYGVDFKNYKPTTIKRRILRRMVMNKIGSIKDFIKLLKSKPDELKNLYDDLLINVTSFFRDREVYDAIKKNVFPQIFDKRKKDEPVRIWVTACSTGEEAYSIAILLLEYLGTKASSYQIQIFATDLSEAGVEIARSGIYPEDIKNDISPERLRKYFVHVDGKYQIIKPIRDMCIFARQNLVQDPPFSKIDLITCRNVLIYLGQVLQNKVMPIFHYSLRSDGFLVLGTSETVGVYSKLFSTFDKKNKIFCKISNNEKYALDFTLSDYNVSPNNNLTLPVRLGNKILNAFDLQKEAESIITAKYAPAHVIVNKDMEIIQFRGQTSTFLNLPQGIANYNLLKMVKEGLETDLRVMVRKAVKDNGIVRREGISYRQDGIVKEANLAVVPMNGSNQDDDRLLIVIFEDVKRSKAINLKTYVKANKKLSEGDSQYAAVLKKDLANTRERLNTIIEQQEVTNEELRAANEEIQSSNEELQSTNEELETAKEELQSTNEELQTVNDELQNRNSQLVSLNNDLNNLLGSINIPVVMLDMNLRIRRYTNVSERALKLISSDIGRKFTDINFGLNIPDFEKMLLHVMDTLSEQEIDVQDSYDNWYSIRIRPYKTLDNKIDGVIIAFIEINDLRRSINKLLDSKKMMEDINKELKTRDKEMAKMYERSSETLEAQIEESKNAEETLRILSRHLVDAQESERLKIARDLHDSVNQMLTAVKMKIHSAETAVKEKRSTKTTTLKDINIAKDLLNKTINEIRRISKNLRPGLLDDLGIDITVKSLIDEFKERNDVKVELKSDKLNDKLNSDAKLAVYRILQETLQNIEKHAHATRVFISLKYITQSVKMVVKDNGTGFNFEKLRTQKTFKKKFGLISMKERAEAVGGKFEIASVPSVGTKISVFIPIYKKSKIIKK
ncbi:MAG: chemotaxis protein CheR [Ignavibacteriae bacterium]|nr:MAG: chemotaxis protein CheR [Ignavibacteriota bacterium]